MNANRNNRADNKQELMIWGFAHRDTRLPRWIREHQRSDADKRPHPSDHPKSKVVGKPCESDGEMKRIPNSQIWAPASPDFLTSGDPACASLIYVTCVPPIQIISSYYAGLLGEYYTYADNLVIFPTRPPLDRSNHYAKHKIRGHSTEVSHTGWLSTSF